MSIKKNLPKVLTAWSFYDWANSTYSLVITSTIFPIYFLAVAKGADGGEVVDFWGWEVYNSVLYSYSLSISFLLIAILSPFLTAISDYTGRKKEFMQFFCYLGAASCAGLYFFTAETLEISIILFILAGVGFNGSIIFYNAYLPVIATEDRFDRVSAKGFALGYIGSVILLLFSLSMLMAPDIYGGISGGLASRISFLCTGIWWFAFAQYTFFHLPKEPHLHRREKHWIFKGVRELRDIIEQLKGQRLLTYYLLSFFFFNMGAQTVMYVATLFGEQELQLPSENLIITILILQLVAIGGSYFFAFLSERFGNTNALMVSIVIWIFICFGAYFVQNGKDFYILAAVVGLVMGGIQSLARSTYAKLIPEEEDRYASYFSFFAVVEKVSIVIGTLSYGLIAQLSGTMRNSVLALAVFFIIGLLLLMKVPSRKSYRQIM